MLTDSVSALSIGKRIANGCEFHWTPKGDNNLGSCILIKPDGKRVEFEVDEHDVPYLLEHRATAVPAQMPENKEMCSQQRLKLQKLGLKVTRD